MVDISQERDGEVVILKLSGRIAGQLRLRANVLIHQQRRTAG